MGRSASHIALECAMQTQPNICLIGEEVQEKKQSLAQVVNTIADAVETRAADGNNFGVVLVPEGLIEFIPEMGVLIEEINELLAKEAKGYAACSGEAEQFAFISGQLSQKSQAVFNLLPAKIKKQLLMDRDPHGNVQVSRIETEKLLAEMVGNELAKGRRKARTSASILPSPTFSATKADVRSHPISMPITAMPSDTMRSSSSREDYPATCPVLRNYTKALTIGRREGSPSL